MADDTKPVQFPMSASAYTLLKRRAKHLGLSTGQLVENLLASLELRLKRAYAAANIRETQVSEPVFDPRCAQPQIRLGQPHIIVSGYEQMPVCRDIWECHYVGTSLYRRTDHCTKERFLKRQVQAIRHPLNLLDEPRTVLVVQLSHLARRLLGLGRLVRDQGTSCPFQRFPLKQPRLVWSAFHNHVVILNLVCQLFASKSDGQVAIGAGPRE